MAAPPEITIENLSGKFAPNKRLSDNIDPLLELQGVSWLARKAIGLAPASFSLRQYRDDNEQLHLETTTYVAKLSQTNDRVLDWQPVIDRDAPLGALEVRVRYIDSLSQIDSDDEASRRFLAAETLLDGSSSSWLSESSDRHIQCADKSVKQAWTVQQVWGFEEIEGKRYHTRRAVVQKGDVVRRARMVYDYAGEL